MASRPGELSEAVLGELDLLRPQRGKVRSGSGPSFRFSPRAGQLWRFVLGSNAAVLKKIGRGGTVSAKNLRSQMDYLFGKSEAIFGNAVVHDPQARGLAIEERREIAEAWSDDWRGAPKNGHTTHLLMSFPSHVRPEKAHLIAEAWAFEMFQSGQHQDEEWAYVAALHTDRPHPHVHVVVNNRGLAHDTWFYMARDHVFNLDTMKQRMVEIAAEEGVFLEATSRAERGIVTYCPSRAEIERARNEGRAPVERPREGKALEEALATMARTADTMKSLTQAAALTGLPEIGAKFAKAEATLRRGGVISPFPVEAVTRERADLDRRFGDWMEDTADRIRNAPAAERQELRDEFYGYAIDIARGLGDARSARLMQMMPELILYTTDLAGDLLTQGREVTMLRPGAVERLRSNLLDGALSVGLSSDRLVTRLKVGAANAWEERNWVRSDILALAARRRLDRYEPEQGRRAAEELQDFYDKAAGLIERTIAHEAVPNNERLVQTLGRLCQLMRTEGTVSFRTDDDAERFAAELRQRYGEGIVAALAAGQTDGLVKDVEDVEARYWVARAVVSAAKSHVALGLTLQAANEAERKLVKAAEVMGGPDWEL